MHVDMAVDTIKVLHTGMQAPLVHVRAETEEQMSIENLKAENCTRDDHVLSARDYWNHLSLRGWLIFGGLCLLCLLSTVILAEVTTFVRKNVSSAQRRLRFYYISAMFSVFSWCSLGSLAVPRAAPITELVIALYLSGSIFHMFQLLHGYYGDGRKSDVKTALREVKIQLRSPPCCCCCCCCPQIRVTRRVLNCMKLAVFQIAVVAPVISFVSCTIIMDGSYITQKGANFNSPSFYLTLVSAISTLSAMYALLLFYRASCSGPLSPQHRLQGKMATLQACLVCVNLQPVITSILAGHNVIPCTPPLSSQARGQALHYFLLIIEMTVISLVTRRFWHSREAERSTTPMHKHDTSNGTMQQQQEASELLSEITKDDTIMTQPSSQVTISMVTPTAFESIKTTEDATTQYQASPKHTKM